MHLTLEVREWDTPWCSLLFFSRKNQAGRQASKKLPIDSALLNWWSRRPPSLWILSRKMAVEEQSSPATKRTQFSHRACACGDNSVPACFLQACLPTAQQESAVICLNVQWPYSIGTGMWEYVLLEDFIVRMGVGCSTVSICPLRSLSRAEPHATSSFSRKSIVSVLQMAVSSHLFMEELWSMRL